MHATGGFSQQRPRRRLVQECAALGLATLTLSPIAMFTLGCAGHAPAPAAAGSSVGADELRGPEAFGGIADRNARAGALFAEASRVMLHPRCLNCHPDGDSPSQGDHGRIHDPPVARGDKDSGVVGMQCSSCHQDHNLELARVPGAPSWHLAPRVMAWVGRPPAALCEQLKDPARNGGRTLAQIVEHSAHDALVGWGWTPGHGRAAAPGSQARFGALMAAWVDAGAACPAAATAAHARVEAQR